MTLHRTPDELAALRARPRRLLAVFAHPDDEAYGCAGALARAGADPETAAVLLVLTRGEASSMGARRGLDAAAVGALREDRLLRVAEHVGLEGLLIAGLPDGALARLDLECLAEPLRCVLAAFAPQVVITHDARGVNGHADHIATHWSVRRALSDHERVRLALVAYTATTCEAARPRLLFATREDEIDVTLRLSGREIEAKEACLRAHDALVTLCPEAAGDLLVRPPVEHFDLLGEDFDPPRDDLFG